MNNERNESYSMVNDQDTDRAGSLGAWGAVMLVAALLATILLTTSSAEGEILGGIPGLGRAVMIAIVQWLG